MAPAAVLQCLCVGGRDVSVCVCVCGWDVSRNACQVCVAVDSLSLIGQVCYIKWMYCTDA